MIPYQELVASLTEWRARQGLPTGQTDYLGAPMPMPLVGPPQPEPESAPAEEYAELADSEILSEEPDGYSEYGEMGQAEAYPGEEAVSFPDTEAAVADDYGATEYSEPPPAEEYGQEPAQADAWGEPQPAANEWDAAPEEPAVAAEQAPAAEAWDEAPAPEYDEAQPEAASWEAAPEPAAAYEGENEVTEFAPPPEHEDAPEYAEVMDEPQQPDFAAQTWDTEAEVEAVPAADGGLYEQDPFATGDADQSDDAFEAEPPPLEAEPPPLEAAGEEGDSTMDVDPEEILSAEDLEAPRTEAGEIGGDADPFAEPPPLEPPPAGEQPAEEELEGGVAVDPSLKLDPDQQ